MMKSTGEHRNISKHLYFRSYKRTRRDGKNSQTSTTLQLYNFTPLTALELKQQMSSLKCLECLFTCRMTAYPHKTLFDRDTKALIESAPKCLLSCSVCLGVMINASQMLVLHPTSPTDSRTCLPYHFISKDTTQFVFMQKQQPL